jgi:hypothetical protein
LAALAESTDPERLPFARLDLQITVCTVLSLIFQLVRADDDRVKHCPPRCPLTVRLVLTAALRPYCLPLLSALSR